MLEFVAIGAGLLVILIRVTGGATVWIGPVRVRAHDPTLPFVLAVIAAASAVLLGGWRALVADARMFRAVMARSGGLVLASATFVVGLGTSTFTAGGADSSSYLNEADLFATGRLTVDVPLAQSAPWPNGPWLFAPFGFRPGTEAGTMVPTYAPGFPLTLVAVRALGGPDAAFLVVPALGALGVWLTFWLGRRLDGVGCGLCAAALLACSPVFLFQLGQPMSDVPTMVWWLAAIAMGVHATERTSAAAGALASLAVLTRPNLAPLLLLMGVGLAWHARASRAALHRLLGWFIATGALGLALGAAWQAYAYGSPVRSGYGTAGELFSLTFAWPNLQRYSTWLFQTQTPFIALALAAPLVVRVAEPKDALTPPNTKQRFAFQFSVFGLAFAGAVLVAYLVYAPFDDWTFLRFILPALPLLLLLSALTSIRVIQRLPAAGRTSVAIAITAAVAVLCLTAADQRDVFRFREHERRYRSVGEYLRVHLPPEAIVVTVQHSGSARYYSKLPILRWDAIEPTDLDQTLAWVREQGHRPFVLVERWEEPAFRDRFAASSAIGALDWPPMAHHRAGVALYDPEQRASFTAGRTFATDRIADGDPEHDQSGRP